VCAKTDLAPAIGAGTDMRFLLKKRLALKLQRLGIEIDFIVLFIVLKILNKKTTNNMTLRGYFSVNGLLPVAGTSIKKYQ